MKTDSNRGSVDLKALEAFLMSFVEGCTREVETMSLQNVLDNVSNKLRDKDIECQLRGD